jgi:hypothetical protein
MKVSSSSDHRLHHRMLGLLTRRNLWKTSQSVDEDTDKTLLLQDEEQNSCPEKDRMSLGATLRNEKIENARSIANAARQQRQRQPTATDPVFTMQNALAERLETKLLANEKECTDLRKLLANEKESINIRNLATAGRLGLPVSLSMLSLGCDPERDWSCVVDDVLLQKLEAKEKECAKGRKLLAEASKRVISRSHYENGVPTTISTPSKTTRPILRREPSSKSSKQVTWGALSSLSLVCDI